MIGIEEMTNNLLIKLNKNKEDFNNVISLHFRLGDYKNLQHCHPLATYEYYKNSLNFIKNKDSTNTQYKVLFFCENDDIDDVTNKINNLEKEFPHYTFVRGDNSLEDWEQLLLMSCCHHNIIANSSFSWWGAYFNSRADKIVCFPSVWFGPSCENDTKDLCPPEWNIISV